MKKRKLLALLKLAEVFDARFGELRQAAYLEALAPLTVEAVEYAVERSIRSEEFFPAPVKLIELAGCYRLPQIDRQRQESVALLPEELAVNRENIARMLATLEETFKKPATVVLSEKSRQERLRELEQQREFLLANETVH